MARVYNRVGRALMPTSFAWRTDARFAGTKHRMNEFIIEFESADDRFPSGSRVTFPVCNRAKVLFGVAGCSPAQPSVAILGGRTDSSGRGTMTIAGGGLRV